VVKAATGQEAIAVLTRRRPKLVLLGNVLTDMNCFSLVEAVAQHPLGELIGIVLAMGRRSPEMTRRARYLGVHATVFQPWNDGRLDVAIRSALAATRKARSRVAVA
jgi:PleD family two-component response regulator